MNEINKITIHNFKQTTKTILNELAKIINTKRPQLFADGMMLVTGEIARVTDFEKALAF